MFSSISGNVRKDIAFFLYVLMGLEMVCPIAAYSSDVPDGGSLPPKYYNYPRMEIISPAANPGFKDGTLKGESIPVATEGEVLNGGRGGNYEDIDGPSQPEMRQFTPVGTNDMVDLFSGDFSYNIPLLDVGGYPVNIAYNGGVTMDQESSWVGLGWSLNPGAVSRNMRGLPDDFNGSDKIIKTNRLKPHTVVGGNLGLGFELAGLPIKLGLSLGAFYNSKSGWGTEIGLNPSINLAGQSKGTQNGGLGAQTGGKDSSSTSIGLNLNFNSQEGASISPSFSYSVYDKEKREAGTASISTNYNSRRGLSDLTMSASFPYKNSNLRYSNSIGGMSFARTSVSPTITMPFTSGNYCFNIAPGGEIFVGHVKVNVTGYYNRSSIQLNDQTQRKAAYGYVYYAAANNNNNALLDFNRDKESPYRDKPMVQNIAIPSYTYDAFSATGEGSLGTFRAYRGDVGHTYDHYIKSKSQSFSGGLDIGAGAGAKWGGNFTYAQTNTSNSGWTSSNGAVSRLNFTGQQGWHEGVYFKNPGESVVARQGFTDQIGADNLMMLTINRFGGSKSPFFGLDNKFATYNSLLSKNGEVTLSSEISTGDTRERRNQVISYLTADEAFRLEPVIASYDTNFFQFGCTPDPYKMSYVDRKDSILRKGHHISMVKVLNTDGRRYEYGIPVYNLENREVTYSLKRGAQVNRETNLAYSKVTGDDIDNVTKQNLGYRVTDEEDAATDQYFMRQITPGYSHSFLLTGVFSSDYMDVTGDGPTEDDLGDGVSFKYSMLYGARNPYRWRTPMHPVNSSWTPPKTEYIPKKVNGVWIIDTTVVPGFTTDSVNGNYEEGLKTDYRDDKASYVAGSKEVWYLNSIESKTMVATFLTERRMDAASQKNELGGNEPLNSKQLMRLKEIRLYSKADYAKNGALAKPIKTVHFEYDYSLCPDYPLNTDTTGPRGKLTLKKIWFAYNDNKKGQQNPYRFNYRNNQSYQYQVCDNWGNYKDPSDNPGSGDLKLNNKDYPYPVSDQAKAGKDGNIAPWSLDSIQLLSGSRIKVTYEADNYGFVQNRRALQLFQIYSLGKSSTLGSVDNRLYESDSDANDHRFIFVKVPFAVSSKKELYERYLEGMEYIFFRLNVQMPVDNYFDIENKRYEFVKLYAKIKDGQYGIADPVNKIIWFEVQGTERKGTSDKGYSPLAKAAIQFLRTDVPMKAYPGSAFPADKSLSIGTFASALIGSFRDIGKMINGFHGAMKKKQEGKYIDLATSFVRLASPGFSKTGGGYRVRKVVISDNWNAMTGQKEALYGQEYLYTTARMVGGKKTMISSGVATYEPFVGGEENPYKFPIENYNDQSSLLGPVNTMYTEGPLMESFYPAASVGYSKVTVRSIYHKNIKSLTGRDETRFYTSYDYPIIEQRTPISDGFAKFTTPPSMLNPLKCLAIRRLAFSQGFKIELNDMNGKMRSQASFTAADSIHPISSTEYFYKSVALNATSKKLDNTAQVIDTAGRVTTGQLGRDIELMTDFRQQENTMFSGGVNINAHVFTIGIFPIFIPAFLKFPQFDYSLYQAAAVNKVINRHGILDSVVVVDKGSKVSTENLAYDLETGAVLVSRTRNEFDDPIYSVTLPAHWAYDRMGAAYKNTDIALKGVNFSSGVISGTSSNEQYFVPGDEVLVYSPYSSAAWWNSTRLYVVKAAAYTTGGDKAYTNPISGVPGYPAASGYYSGLRFVTRTGQLYSDTALLNIKIIRSGRRNTSLTPVGSLTTLTNPIVGGQLKINEQFNMLNVAATEFREDFKMAANYWITDSCNQVCGCEPGYTYNENLKLCLKRSVEDSPTLSTRKFVGSGSTNYPYGVVVYNKSFPALLDFGRSFVSAEYQPVDARYKGTEYGYGRQNARAFVKGLGVFCHDNDPFWIRTRVNSLFTQGRMGASAIILGDTLGKAPGGDGLTPYTSPSRGSGVEKYLFFPFDKLCYIGVGGNAFYSLVVDCDTVFQRIYEQHWCQQPYTNTTSSDSSKRTFWHVIPYVFKKGLHRVLFYGGSAFGEGFPNFAGEIYDNTADQIINASGGKGLNIIFSTNAFRNKPAYPNSNPPDSCNDCVKLAFSSRPYCAPVNLDNVNFYFKQPNICTTVAPVISTEPYINPYKLGILGNYRPFRDYTYYKNRKEQSVIGTTSNIRQYGTIDTFRAFWTFQGGWLKPTYQSDWVWNSENTLYHRRGDIIESKDPLNRYTSGQYGYNNTLPVAVTQNSRYRESAFDGFEDYRYQTASCTVSDSCEKRPRRHFDWSRFTSRMKTTQSHTGLKSLELAPGDSVTVQASLKDTGYDSKPVWLRMNTQGIVTDESAELPVFGPTLQDSIIITAWVKETGPCLGSYDKTDIRITFRNSSTSAQTTLPVMKPTGLIIEGWQKIEGMVKVPSGYSDMYITLRSSVASGNNAYFDDIRVHPYHSNMKSFVYDPVSLRLMAELDENNYASFYEYDNDGTLVRVKKETEAGIMTIKETRSALIKE
jgi:hypothetical protein